MQTVIHYKYQPSRVYLEICAIHYASILRIKTKDMTNCSLDTYFSRFDDWILKKNSNHEMLKTENSLAMVKINL